jgi:hypothetical protein
MAAWPDFSQAIADSSEKYAWFPRSFRLLAKWDATNCARPAARRRGHCRFVDICNESEKGGPVFSLLFTRARARRTQDGEPNLTAITAAISRSGVLADRHHLSLYRN